MQEAPTGQLIAACALGWGFVPIERALQEKMTPDAFALATLQLTEAQERTSHVQLKIEQARVVQQQKWHEASLPALPPEDTRARVRQLEVRPKDMELAIMECELELASRKAVLAGLQVKHSGRQLHLQGDVAAVRQAADAARFNAEKQPQEQQQRAGEAPLPRGERARLARAVLPLHQQQTRTGDVPADVTALLASFGLGEFELASSKASSEAAEFEDIVNDDGASLAGASDGAEGPSDVGSADGGAAAALSDGPKPLHNETLAKLIPGVMSGAFWLSPLKEGARLVYYRCSKCKDQHEELISELGDLQVQKNLAAAADFGFLCEDCE